MAAGRSRTLTGPQLSLQGPGPRRMADAWHPRPNDVIGERETVTELTVIQPPGEEAVAGFGAGGAAGTGFLARSSMARTSAQRASQAVCSSAGRPSGAFPGPTPNSSPSAQPEIQRGRLRAFGR